MIRHLLCFVVIAGLLVTDLYAATATAATVTFTAPDMPSWLPYVLFGLGALGATVLDSTMMTLIDYAKLLDPDDQVARIINLLAQKNEMLQDMPFMEGNLITGHRTTMLTGLPTVYWRLLNQPVPPSKERTAQVDEQTGMLEAYSEVDVKLANLGGNAGAVRLSKARAFLEAMSQEMQSTVLYGSAAAPEEFIGLAPRYSSLSAGNADNIISAGGTGSTDNTSIWRVEWGEGQVSGIYPKGSKVGLQHEDLGIETKESTDGLMRVYRDHWSWDMGIALEDWRHVGRIANIDVSNLSNASDAADLLFFMADLEERMQEGTGRAVFYMNRTVARFLRHQTREAVGDGGGITWETVGGRRIRMFGSTPIRIVDAILNTEDVVA
jgi:hypothetical protein